MSRVINGLVWAKPCARPRAIPASRPRGAKAAGLRYERALAAALPKAKHGQWFEFEDRNGPGWCQTDLLLELPSGVLVLESKYTWVPEGHQQVEDLYLPVVAKALAKPTFGGVVAKVLTPGPYLVARDLQTFTQACVARQRAVLHWIGVGPIAWD